MALRNLSWYSSFGMGFGGATLRVCKAVAMINNETLANAADILERLVVENLMTNLFRVPTSHERAPLSRHVPRCSFG